MLDETYHLTFFLLHFRCAVNTSEESALEARQNAVMHILLMVWRWMLTITSLFVWILSKVDVTVTTAVTFICLHICRLKLSRLSNEQW